MSGRLTDPFSETLAEMRQAARDFARANKRRERAVANLTTAREEVEQAGQAIDEATSRYERAERRLRQAVFDEGAT